VRKAGNIIMITTELKEARVALNQDRIVAIPTETVYGLAGNAFSEKALDKIFTLKKRPYFNPLIVHIRSAEYLTEVARDIPDKATVLANEFWPGPLTLVLKKQSRVPDLATSGKDTVAIRVPDHPVTLELLAQLEYPLAAPSANPFGSISPTSAQHVYQYFNKDLDVILDGGACEKGIESTIIGFENGQPILYRLGSLSLEKIEEKIGTVLVKTHSEDASPSAPGMLSRHYAPTTNTYLTEDIAAMIASHDDKTIGLLLFKDSEQYAAAHREVLSVSGDLEEAAKNLYAAMHRLDNLKLDMIVAEQLPDIGIGRTMNDKLRRATQRD
jgi:L-threonylcarbamoyladenylate synthase